MIRGQAFNEEPLGHICIRSSNKKMKSKYREEYVKPYNDLGLLDPNRKSKNPFEEFNVDTGMDGDDEFEFFREYGNKLEEEHGNDDDSCALLEKAQAPTFLTRTKHTNKGRAQENSSDSDSSDGDSSDSEEEMDSVPQSPPRKKRRVAPSMRRSGRGI